MAYWFDLRDIENRDFLDKLSKQSETIEDLSKLAQGQIDISDVLSNIFSPNLEKRFIEEVLPQLNKTVEGGALENLSLLSQSPTQPTPTDTNLLNQLQALQNQQPPLDRTIGLVNRGLAQVSKVDPMYLYGLISSARLAQYGIPTDKINLPSPQAATEYINAMNEIIEQSKKLTEQATGVASNPPTYEEPKFLPFLGILGGLAGAFGGAGAALPFLAAASALKSSSRQAYESETQASKLVLSGVEEARQNLRLRAELEEKKYGVSKEQLAYLDKVLQQFDSQKVSQILSDVVSELKTTGSFVDTINKLPLEDKVALLNSEIGKSLADYASREILSKNQQNFQLMRLMLEDKLMKERMLLQSQLSRENALFRASLNEKDIQDIQALKDNPRSFINNDALNSYKLAQSYAPYMGSKPDLLQQIIETTMQGKEISKDTLNELQNLTKSDVDSAPTRLQFQVLISHITSKTPDLVNKILNQLNPQEKEKVKATIMSIFDAWKNSMVGVNALGIKSSFEGASEKFGKDGAFQKDTLNKIEETLTKIFLEKWGFLIDNGILTEDELMKEARNYAQAYLDYLTGAFRSLQKQNEITKEDTSSNNNKSQSTEQTLPLTGKKKLNKAEETVQNYLLLH